MNTYLDASQELNQNMVVVEKKRRKKSSLPTKKLEFEIEE